MTEATTQPAQQQAPPPRRGIGVVAIGRNEGERLRRCLESVRARAQTVVYVDSGSTDNSIRMAREMGVEVVELDLGRPFTAARARNAGFERALKLSPHLEFIQFVDGDCEVVEGWLEKAEQALRSDQRVAVVCGRRRERFPDASRYNRLCDIEWNTPIGEARACGGDAMIRVEAMRQVGGYDPGLIAGEEPELCFRLRQQNWKILRIDADMTLHDAAMTRFGQWWKRALRGGHAYAEAASMYGRTPERFRVRETRSIWFWGALLPAAAVALAVPTKGASMLMLASYGLLAYRISRRERARVGDARVARMYAVFCILAKFPQAAGQAKYWLRRLRGRPGTLIEYK